MHQPFGWCFFVYRFQFQPIIDSLNLWGDFVKKGAIISLLLSIIFSFSVFFLLGLLLLPAEVRLKSEPNPTPADDFVSGVEYYSAVENCSVLLLFEDGSGALLYLDFGARRIDIKIYNDNPKGQAEACRYGVDNTLVASRDFLAAFCDRLGGISFTEGGTKRNYLSSSLRGKLSEKADFSTRQNITAAFFEKISKIGLSTDDFKFIIEETKNDLNFTVCYDWAEYFAEMAENITIEKG